MDLLIYHVDFFYYMTETLTSGSFYTRFTSDVCFYLKLDCLSL